MVRGLVRTGWCLVVVQAIAWWGFRADPLDLARHVPFEIGFILPEALRPAAPAEADVIEDIFDSPESSDPAPEDSRRNTDPPRDLPSQLPRSLAADATEPSQDAPHATASAGADRERMASATDPPIGQGSVTRAGYAPDAALPAPAANSGSVSYLPKTTEQLTVIRAKKGAPGGGPVPDALAPPKLPSDNRAESIFYGSGPRWAQKFAIDDVEAGAGAVRRANQALDQTELLGSSAEERKETAKLTYAVLCGLAERTTMLKRGHGLEEAADARSVLGEIAENSNKVRLFSNAARNWVSKRLGRGVTFGATIQSVQRNGEVYVVKARLLDSKDTRATMITRANPSENPWTIYGTGDRVFVGGVVVDDPAVRLPGYPGNEPWVVYVTNHIVLLP